jgi:outer membrane protein assembly factor BamD
MTVGINGLPTAAPARRLLSRSRAGALAGLVAVSALLALGACASAVRKPPTGATNADKFLFDRGTEALNDHKWFQSREYFREIVDNYPQSAYRADAKLGIGDTYLGEGTSEANVLAINEFREFLNYYPTNPRADYAQYKLGLAHFEQMRGPQRDQTETKAAITEFETFLDRYPKSDLIGQVREKLREAKDRLDESDYDVGIFYYRAKWYPGAIDRFKAVLTRDPEYTARDNVYYYLAESLIKTNRSAEALPYLERLVSEFPQSQHLEDAKRRIAELKSGHDSHTH